MYNQNYKEYQPVNNNDINISFNLISYFQKRNYFIQKKTKKN